MKLKRKIDTAAFDALSDEMKGYYQQSGDGYTLDAESDTGEELKRAKAHEQQARKAAETARDEALARVVELEAAATQGAGSVSEVEERWKAKEVKTKKTHDDEVVRLKAQLSTLLVNNKASEIANDISVEPELMLPHILKRLKADLTSEEPGTLILDADGNVSALSLDDLKKEFVANPKFSRIVKQSSASGSGARPNSGGGGAPQKKTFDQMNDGERAELHCTDPTAFDAAVKTEQAKKRGY